MIRISATVVEVLNIGIKLDVDPGPGNEPQMSVGSDDPVFVACTDIDTLRRFGSAFGIKSGVEILVQVKQ